MRKEIKKITIDAARCPANHPCPAVRICPVDAIIQEQVVTGLPVIDEEKCTKCGKCVRYCGMGAIQAEYE